MTLNYIELCSGQVTQMLSEDVDLNKDGRHITPVEKPHIYIFIHIKRRYVFDDTGAPSARRKQFGEFNHKLIQI